MNPRGMPWHWPSMDAVDEDNVGATIGVVRQRNAGLTQCGR
jgi:hypothetical protein